MNAYLYDKSYGSYSTNETNRGIPESISMNKADPSEEIQMKAGRRAEADVGDDSKSAITFRQQEGRGCGLGGMDCANRKSKDAFDDSHRNIPHEKVKVKAKAAGRHSTPGGSGSSLLSDGDGGVSMAKKANQTAVKKASNKNSSSAATLIFQPTANDVLFGRGKRKSKHGVLRRLLRLYRSPINGCGFLVAHVLVVLIT